MTAHPVIAAPPRTVRVTLPLKVVNESNQRSRWGTARRTKQARGTVGMVVRMQVGQLGPPPYVVTLTRIAPRNLDSDGVVSALKATRDGVADALGINDGDERVEWRYGQRRGSPRDVTIVRGYGVCVEICSRP